MSNSDDATPLTRLSLAEQVRERMREAIICGEFPQGGTLPEPVIAARYQVSRAPVRETSIALEREGLNDFDERGRSRVIELTTRVFEELVTVCIALEGPAARLAAIMGGAKLASGLESNVVQQSKAGTYRELTRLDVAFHETIVRATKNDGLLAAWLTVRSVFEFWLGAAFRDVELSIAPLTLAMKSHRRLLYAITSGDAVQAEEAAVSHITRWRSYLTTTARSAILEAAK